MLALLTIALSVTQQEVWESSRSDPHFKIWNEIDAAMRAFPGFMQRVSSMHDMLMFDPVFETPTKKHGRWLEPYVPVLPDAASNTYDSIQHVMEAIAKNSIPGTTAFEQPTLLSAVDTVASYALHGKIPDLLQRRIDFISFCDKSAQFFQLCDSVIVYPRMSSAVKHVAGKYSVSFMHAAILAMRYTDYFFAINMVTGYSLTGALPRTGIHRIGTASEAYCQTKPHTGPEFSAHCEQWNRKLIKRMKAKGLAATPHGLQPFKDVYQATMYEVGNGTAIPKKQHQLRAMCPKGYPLLERFAHYRGPGIPCRQIDNGKSCGINDMSSNDEHIVCETADFPCRVAKLFYDKLSGSGVAADVIHGSDDFKKAYRQLANDDPCFSIVAIYAPDTHEVLFFHIPGFVFGIGAAVPQFNRMPRFFQEFARCFGAVCCCQYVDDMSVAELKDTAKSSQLFLRRSSEIMRLLFDINKHKSAAYINDFLGVLSDLSQSRDGKSVLQIKESRRTKLIDSILHITQTQLLPESVAKSLSGKLFFATLTSWGKVGRGPIHALHHYETYYDSNEHVVYVVWSKAIAASLAFFLAFLRSKPRKILDFRSYTRNALIAWSDAMWEDGCGRIGWVLYDPETTEFYYSSMLIPQWIVKLWIKKQTYIGQAEIFAAMLVYWSMPAEIFKDRHVNHYIDNMSAISAFSKGSSPKADSSWLVSLLQLFLMPMNTTVRYKHVRSEANVSDDPSRNVFNDVCLRLRATWVACKFMTAAEYILPMQQWLPSFEQRIYKRQHKRAKR